MDIKPKIPKGIYDFASDLVNEIQFMPTQEQRTEHLARAIKVFVDHLIRIIAEDINERFYKGEK